MSRDISSYSPLNLGPKPAEVERAAAGVRLLRAGPGRVVTFAESVQLAEDTYNARTSLEDPATRLGVLAATEMLFGWVLMLQTLRYIETRNDDHLMIGHGVTIVDRENGDVYGYYGIGSPWSAIAEFHRLREKRTLRP